MDGAWTFVFTLHAGCSRWEMYRCLGHAQFLRQLCQQSEYSSERKRNMMGKSKTKKCAQVTTQGLLLVWSNY
jgi:hypothetical protein